MIRLCLHAVTQSAPTLWQRLSIGQGALRGLIIGLGVALLSACNILPESPQLNHYELPTTALEPLGEPAPYTLQLLTPYANRTLSTQRILVNPEGHELRAYDGAAWVDTAPALLRERFAQALLDTQLVYAMTFSGESGAPELVLQTHLYRFQVHYDDGQPVVHVQLNAQLINRQTGKILAVHPVYVKRPVTDGVQLEQVIPVFGQAADDASRQLTQWLHETLQQPNLLHPTSSTSAK